MVNIQGNKIYRAGREIGYIEGNHIWSEGKRVAYVEGNHVYSAANNQKLYSLEGDKVYDARSPNKNVPIESVTEQVQGGECSDAHRAAIHFLLG